MDFRNYRLCCLGNFTSSYDKSRINRRKKKLVVEIYIHLFNPADPISILHFLQKFRWAGNNRIIHEYAEMFLFAQFMMESAKTDLLDQLEEEDDSDHYTDSENDHF